MACGSSFLRLRDRKYLLEFQIYNLLFRAFRGIYVYNKSEGRHGDEIHRQMLIVK